MRRVTEKPFTPSEAMDGAYSLSYRLLAGDMESALSVTRESMNEWKVDWTAQRRRTYHPGLTKRTPNKILFSPPPLLQYIVCQKTTPYEVAHERAFLDGNQSLTEGTLVLRFIKHTVHECSTRSFNMAIGNYRILHKYDHATTKRFLAVVDQRNQELLVDGQPDNFTDDEYRRWKMILVNRLEYRFKEFVTVIHGPRNEKRFLPNDQSSSWSEYARECLGLLTPWKTEHILPEEFEPTKFNISKLKCKRRDEWDSVEENRMHTIIDPECSSRLAKACGAPAPEHQIDIPQFKNVEHGSGGGSDTRTPAAPELTGAQVNSIRDELERKATRRRVAVSEQLSVEVDGVERGWLDTANNSDVRLDLNSESRQIQVFTTDGEGKLLLASLWLSLIDIAPDTGWQSEIALEGGQHLGIDIRLAERDSLTALISYEECNPLRIVMHYFEQIRGAIPQQLQLDTILNHARSMQGAIHSHRSEFASLIFLIAVTLSLIVLAHNIPPTENQGVQAGTDNVVGFNVGHTRFTFPRPLKLATHENQVTGPPLVGSQDREPFLQVRPRTERLALTDVYSIDPRQQTVKTPATPLSSQSFLSDRTALWDLYGSSELVTSAAELPAQGRPLSISGKTFIFVARHDYAADGVRNANRTKFNSSILAHFYVSTDGREAFDLAFSDLWIALSHCDSSEEKLVALKRFYLDSGKSRAEGPVTASEVFSPSTLNWERLYPYLVADRPTAAQPLRSSISANTPKELPRRDPSRWQTGDFPPKVSNQVMEIAHLYEQARRARLEIEAFNLFNANPQLSNLKSLREATAPNGMRGADMWREKEFLNAGCVKQSQTALDCRNYAHVSDTAPLRFGVKFQF